MAKTYLDSAGLELFLTNLKNAYAGNTASGSNFTVGQAGKLSTARTIGLSGDVSGTATSFDGSENITISTTIADVVASTSGAGGSHGLMTAAQAEKLAGVASGAQVNVIEGVATSNSDTVTVANKIATIDLSAYALKTDITAVMKFKGTKTSDELAAITGMEIGDVYQIVSGGTGTAYNVGSEYAYNGSTWVELGPVIDLSGYATTASLGTAAYAATTDFVSSTLAPAEAGAQVNDIEVINFKGNGDSSAAPLTITNKEVTIDVSGYALSSQIPQAAASIADGATGYATGDQVYDYIEALPIPDATINSLFGISNS